jgi:hypothetical protein
MKKLLTFAILALCWVLVMASCTTTTVRVVTTDKAGTVTDTTTTTKAGDPNALALAGQIATAYAPRGIVVRQERRLATCKGSCAGGRLPRKKSPTDGGQRNDDHTRPRPWAQQPPQRHV